MQKPYSLHPVFEQTKSEGFGTILTLNPETKSSIWTLKPELYIQSPESGDGAESARGTGRADFWMYL